VALPGEGRVAREACSTWGGAVVLLKAWRAGREGRIVREVLVVVYKHVRVAGVFVRWRFFLVIFPSYKCHGEGGVADCLA
jgi:hypothetical protein